MMKRLLSLLLAVALIFVLAVPASAAEESGWVELLEYSSILPNGENSFTMSGSGSVTIPLYTEKRLRKIDMLIWNPTGQRFSTAKVTSGSTTNTLDVLAIGSNLTRIVGYVPNARYEEITVNFTKSTTSTQTYEVLSCKVTPVGVQEFVCDADVFLHDSMWDISQNIYLSGVSDDEIGSPYQARINVYDWEKYDSLSIWGSVADANIESIRASLSTSGLPITVNFIETSSQGEWTEYVQDSGGTTGASFSAEYYGKYLFCVTIDLANVDRSLISEPLYLYITGTFVDAHGMTFNCQYVNGHVYTADTTNVTWWNRFTSFMSELFGADESSDALDDLGSSSDSISQGASDIHDFEQTQQAVLDTNFSTIQNAVSFTNFAAALVFVQRYANMTFDGISNYAIVLTLPLFLGLFFYLCSRIPGVTRWKSRPPKAKGGDDP